MPATIERPVFEEGQILGAEDLRILLDYSRNQDARHARCAHLWGIAEGLDVRAVGGNLEVASGMAIDASGAAIILTEKTIVTPGQFTTQLTNGEESGLYPVFLGSRANKLVGQHFAGGCGDAAGYRQAESGAVQFARASALVEWDTQQKPPAIAKGPADPGAYQVLLGFADWDKDKKTFKGFSKKHPDGYRPRYIGVRAETVEAPSGRLVLRVTAPDVKDIALVHVDLNEPKKMFAFGLDNGRGDINRLFWIDKDGNVTAKGVISGAAALKKGEVHVQSGKATDGIHLQLPAGITREQVKAGTISVHLLVTPNFAESDQPRLPIPTNANPTPLNEWTPRVKECYIDRETFEVRCVFEWFKAVPVVTGANTDTRPGVCDYLLIATVNS